MLTVLVVVFLICAAGFGLFKHHNDSIRDRCQAAFPAISSYALACEMRVRRDLDISDLIANYRFEKDKP